MMLLHVLIAYVLLICINSHPHDNRHVRDMSLDLSTCIIKGAKCDPKNEKLTAKQYTSLVADLNLYQSPKHFVSTQMWQSTEMTDGKPQAKGQLLIFKKKYCGSWTSYSVDRYYHWHEGEAIIDKISPNGTRVREYLGSTRLNEDRKYVVHSPAGWYSNIKISGNFAVFTSVLMNYKRGDGKIVDISTMIKKFGKDKIIKETKKCYKAKLKSKTK